MIHVCVQKFDVTGTVENFLKTKPGLNMWNQYYKNGGAMSIVLANSMALVTFCLNFFFSIKES